MYPMKMLFEVIRWQYARAVDTTHSDGFRADN